MDLNEDQILKRINKHDLSSWKFIYSEYYGAMCSYSTKLVSDRDVSMDIVQETFIKIWKNKTEFDSLKNFTWYLYKAVYNNSMYYLRNEKYRKEAYDSANKDIVEFSDEDFALAVREEMIRSLRVYIDKMPSERRKVMLLVIEGKTSAEIAEILNVSINTVKTQRSRSLKFLRENMTNLLALLSLI